MPVGEQCLSVATTLKLFGIREFSV